MAFVAFLYLIEALIEFFRTERCGKLVKFAWMCIGFAVVKAAFKAAIWAVNL